MIKVIYKTILVVAILATSLFVNAQQDINTNFLYKPDTDINDTLGRIVYHESEALASILRKNIAVNIVETKYRGYRIQIFSVSGVNSKDKANKAKAELLMDYDDIQVYIVYNEPYFKVRVGDFLTKLEALSYLQKLQKDYPFAFVVGDYINYPGLQIENDVQIEN